jgi:hypothetical protein
VEVHARNEGSDRPAELPVQESQEPGDVSIIDDYSLPELGQGQVWELTIQIHGVVTSTPNQRCLTFLVSFRPRALG